MKDIAYKNVFFMWKLVLQNVDGIALAEFRCVCVALLNEG